MQTHTDQLGAKLDADGSCPSCGRDYSGTNAKHCHADDDCPSFWEERGIAHPDHPETAHLAARAA